MTAISADSNLVTFAPMSARVERLKQQQVRDFWIKKPWWGADLVVDDEPGFYELPLVVRKARAVRSYLRAMPVVVREDQLVMGDIPMSSMGLGRIFPNYATDEEARTAGQHSLSIKSVYGHSIPDHTRVLNEGLDAVRADALARAESAPSQELRDFYVAAALACEGPLDLADRYAAALDEAAAAHSDPARAAELREMADRSRRVPREPARSFHDAVQSFWFMHAALHATMDVTPIGRIDQFLYPFLRNDLEVGDITLAKAQELIYSLWLKFNERTLLDPDLFEYHCEFGEYSLAGQLTHMDNAGGALHWLQELMVGGVDRDGNDATNEISFMALEATQQLQMTNPITNVRFHEGSPPQLLAKAAEVIRSGGGMPPIFNDSVIIPSLVEMGIPLEDARDYAPDGCWEVLIPGKSEFRYTEIHLLKAVEWAINSGRSISTGENESIDTGDATRFTSFEQLLDAFKAQLRDYIDVQMRITLDTYGLVSTIAPSPLFSAVLDGCLESGRDYTAGGARYLIHAPLANGVANAADALYAVKTLVFDEAVCDMPTLLSALQANWDGFEALRAQAVGAPKHGNDEHAVDALAAQLVDFYLECLHGYRTQAWDRHRMMLSAGVGTFERYRILGKYIGATPDGRAHGEPISPNLSPSVGSDRSGPLAAVASYAKLPLGALPCGSVLDLKLAGGPLQSEEGHAYTEHLLREFLDCGGNILTVTVADHELFRAAQADPRGHWFVRVRMGGWQGYFVALDAEHQAHHMARAEHDVTPFLHPVDGRE